MGADGDRWVGLACMLCGTSGPRDLLCYFVFSPYFAPSFQVFLHFYTPFTVHNRCILRLPKTCLVRGPCMVICGYSCLPTPGQNKKSGRTKSLILMLISVSMAGLHGKEEKKTADGH